MSTKRSVRDLYRNRRDDYRKRVQQSTPTFDLDAASLARVFEFCDNRTLLNVRQVSMFFCAVATRQVTYSIWKMLRQGRPKLSAITAPFVDRFVFDVYESEIFVIWQKFIKVPRQDSDSTLPRETRVYSPRAAIQWLLRKLQIDPFNVRANRVELQTRIVPNILDEKRAIKAVLKMFPNAQSVAMWPYETRDQDLFAIPPLQHLTHLKLAGIQNVTVPTLPSLQLFKVKSTGRTRVARQPTLRELEIWRQSYLHQFSSKRLTVEINEFPELRTLTLGCFDSLVPINQDMMPQLTAVNVYCNCMHCCASIGKLRSATSVAIGCLRKKMPVLHITTGYLDHVKRLRVHGREITAAEVLGLPTGVNDMLTFSLPPPDNAPWSRLRIKVLDIMAGSDASVRNIAYLSLLPHLEELRIRLLAEYGPQMDIIKGMKKLKVLALRGVGSIAVILEKLPPVHTLVVDYLYDEEKATDAQLKRAFSGLTHLTRIVLGPIEPHYIEVVWQNIFWSVTIDTVVLTGMSFDSADGSRVQSIPAAALVNVKRVFDWGDPWIIPPHLAAVLPYYRKRAASSRFSERQRHSEGENVGWHENDNYDLMLVE